VVLERGRARAERQLAAATREASVAARAVR
jgi:hypothetical protein